MSKECVVFESYSSCWKNMGRDVGIGGMLRGVGWNGNRHPVCALVQLRSVTKALPIVNAISSNIFYQCPDPSPHPLLLKPQCVQTRNEGG